MRWPEVSKEPCPVARSLAVVGDRWTMLVIREAFLGSRRFEDFEAQLDVSPHVLSTRLSRLVGAEVLAKIPYQDRPVRHEYRLTSKGLDLYPVLIGLARWGNAWDADPVEPLLRLRHRNCGQDFTPRTTCSACGEPVVARDVTAVPSAAMAASRVTRLETYGGRKKGLSRSRRNRR
jgi:DNA-binding HxlR family transcriptional regulator